MCKLIQPEKEVNISVCKAEILSYRELLILRLIVYGAEKQEVPDVFS